MFMDKEQIQALKNEVEEDVKKDIKQAYGQYWDQVKDHVDKYGWITLYQKDWGDLTPKVSKMDIQHQGMCWRMETLRHLPNWKYQY